MKPSRDSFYLFNCRQPSSTGIRYSKIEGHKGSLAKQVIQLKHLIRGQPATRNLVILIESRIVRAIYEKFQICCSMSYFFKAVLIKFGGHANENTETQRKIYTLLMSEFK